MTSGQNQLLYSRENLSCYAAERQCDVFCAGFYCIGNIKSLKENSGLWAAIIDDMHSQGKVGHSLKLTCQNHPQNTVEASSAEDFRQAPEGGCRLPCTARLECGHVCTKACHPVDQEHKEYKCMKPCEKRCASGHRYGGGSRSRKFRNACCSR